MSKIALFIALFFCTKIAAACPTVTSVSTTPTSPLQPYMPARTVNSPPIYITGTGFLTANKVRFGDEVLYGGTVTGGLTSDDFIIIDDNHIMVNPGRTQLQSSPGTVNVVVTNDEGTSLVNIPYDCFTYQGDWFAYVPDFSSGQIYVIDINSENVSDYPTVITPVDTITAGSGSEIVLFTPDGKYGYCTNFSSNTLTIIDTATNSSINFTLGVFSTEHGPIGFAITPGLGNTMLISDYNSHSVTQYDITTREKPLFLTDYTVGANPTSIALNPNVLSSNPLAYTTNSGSGTLSVIDTIALSQGVFRDTGYLTEPVWIAPTPTNENSCQYSQMVLNYGSGGPTSDEVLFYNNLTSETVSSPPMHMLTGFSFNYYPYFPQIVASPDSTLAYVTETKSGGITVIDITGLPLMTPTVVYTIPTDPKVNGVSLTPSGKLGFAGDGTNPQELVIFNGKYPYDSSKITIVGSSNVTNPGIQPDQSPVARAVYSLETDGMTVDFDASESVSPTGTIASYFWDFGDGTTATTASPEISHTYPPCRTPYTATLTVTNSAGTSTKQTYFGQGVYNNGGPLAMFSLPVEVCTLLPPSNPSVRLNRGKCHFSNTITFFAPTSGVIPGPGDFYLIYGSPNKKRLLGRVPAGGPGPFEFTTPGCCRHTNYFLYSQVGNSISCNYTIAYN